MTLSKAKEVTETVLRAVKQAGVRAILAEGWGKLGTAEGVAVPEDVYVLRGRYAPHDWLFPRCAAVVHHGGAGTTGTGLAAGCPTMTLPFFGDQAFWGEMCRRAGVGPAPVAIENLTQQRLLDGLHMLMQPSVQEAARRMAERMAQEPCGTQAAVDSFHRHLQGRLAVQAAGKQLDQSLSSMQNGRDKLADGAAVPSAPPASCSDTGNVNSSSVSGREIVPPVPSRPGPDLEQGRLAPTDSTHDREHDAGHPACREDNKASSVRGPLSTKAGVRDCAGVKYFQRKQLPWLTGGWESAAAFVAVFLLPLISIVPFSTTIERPDASFGQA